MNKAEKTRAWQQTNKDRYQAYKYKYHRTPGRRWILGRSSAKRRGLVWNLTKEDYFLLIDMQCHYCDKQLEPTGIGLDRKDNTKGYILDNVVPCCRRCNDLKSDDITYDEMKVMIKALLNYRSQS